MPREKVSCLPGGIYLSDSYERDLKYLLQWDTTVFLDADVKAVSEFYHSHFISVTA